MMSGVFIHQVHSPGVHTNPTKYSPVTTEPWSPSSVTKPIVTEGVEGFIVVVITYKVLEKVNQVSCKIINYHLQYACHSLFSQSLYCSCNIFGNNYINCKDQKILVCLGLIKVISF